MNMVDLMWLFCGAFIGGLVTLFFSAMLNISHEKTELEHARRKIEKLEEDKRALKIALESPTSPDKGGYTDRVKLLGKDEKALKRPNGGENRRQCVICGHEHDQNNEKCPVCGCPTSVYLEELK